MKSYSELLKDPRWQRRRLEILQRSDFSCEECGDKESTLHVHHKLYRKNAMPWEYEDHELEALCESCHKIKTVAAEETKRFMSRLSVGRLIRIVGYCEGQFALQAIEEDNFTDDNYLQFPDYREAAGFADALPVIVDSSLLAERMTINELKKLIEHENVVRGEGQ